MYHTMKCTHSFVFVVPYEKSRTDPCPYCEPKKQKKNNCVYFFFDNDYCLPIQIVV